MNDAETAPMKVTTRPAERSTVVLEVEFPARAGARAVEESVRHLSRRTKVPGFRPGKAAARRCSSARWASGATIPARPTRSTTTPRSTSSSARCSRPCASRSSTCCRCPSRSGSSFGEAGGASYRVSLPLRPEVKLGAYADYPFGITIDAVDDEAVDKVVEQLRDQQASAGAGRRPRRGRTDDYAVIRFAGYARRRADRGCHDRSGCR